MNLSMDVELYHALLIIVTIENGAQTASRRASDYNLFSIFHGRALSLATLAHKVVKCRLQDRVPTKKHFHWLPIMVFCPNGIVPITNPREAVAILHVDIVPIISRILAIFAIHETDAYCVS